MRSLVLVLGLLSGFSWFGLRDRLEPWLFNPRERTERGVETYSAGESKDSVEQFDTAKRLAPDDPLLSFNAGTAHLAAGDSDTAAELLEQAVEGVDPALRPRALFNLGNARLAGDDPAAAIEAYKSSLRTDPSQQDVKHNLELALRELEKQRQARQQEQEAPQGEKQGEQEQSDEPGPQQPPQEQSDEPQQQDESQQQEGDQSSAGEQEQTADQQPQDDRLQNFEDQPDMTAEQAAAILEAVENLERQQRQEQAARQQKERATGDQDW